MAKELVCLEVTPSPYTICSVRITNFQLTTWFFAHSLTYFVCLLTKHRTYLCTNLLTYLLALLDLQLHLCISISIVVWV